MIRRALCLLGLALVTFSLVALSGPGRIDIDDGQARFEAGRNWVELGRPCLKDERIEWHVMPGRGGENYSYYRLPAEAVAAGMVIVSDATGTTSEGRRHFVFSLQGAFFAAALVVVFAYWFRSIGWAAAGIFATPCWYYATSTFDDLLGTLTVIAAIVLSRSHRTPSIVASAVLLTLAVNCKPPLAAFLLPCLAYSLTSRQRLHCAILILAIPLGWGSHKLYETWKFPPESAVAYQTAIQERSAPMFFGNVPEALLDMIVGPSSGMFWYCPTLVIALAGLGAAGKTENLFAKLTALACLAFIGFVSLLTFYKGGVCWGPRYLTPVFAVLWLFAPQARLSPFLTRSLITLGVLVQLLGLSIVPERLYVERGLPSGFYLIDPWLYLRPEIGHVVNRPREIADALTAPPSPEFTPSPSPTFTLPVFDPLREPDHKGIERVRRYTLLNSFRPWWATFPALPVDQRPVDVPLTAVTFIAIGLTGLLLLRVGTK